MHTLRVKQPAARQARIEHLEDRTLLTQMFTPEPLAVDDHYETRQDVELNWAAPGVLENDNFWGREDELRVVSYRYDESKSPFLGNCKIEPDGSFHWDSKDKEGNETLYWLANGQKWVNRVTYEIEGPTPGRNSFATLEIVVTGFNRRPVIFGKSYDVEEGNVLSVDASHGLLSGAFDYENDKLTVISVFGTFPGRAPFHGSFSWRPDGSFEYDPKNELDWFGEGDTDPASWEDSPVEFAVSDGRGGVSYAPLWINFVGRNDTPTNVYLMGSPLPDHVSAESKVAYFETRDPDRWDRVQDFTYSLVPGEGDTDNSSFAIRRSGEGSFKKDLYSTVDLDFSAHGSYSIRVRSADWCGAFKEEQIVVSRNAPTSPLVFDNTYYVQSNGILTNENVLVDDLPGYNMFTLKVEGLELPPDKGLLTPSPNGDIRYDPEHDFDDLKWGAPSTPPITATLAQTYGASPTPHPSTLTIVVVGARHAPIARDDRYPSITQDEEVIAWTGNKPPNDLLANDSDPDRNPLPSPRFYDLEVTDVDANVPGRLTWYFNGNFYYDPCGQLDWLGEGQQTEITVPYMIATTRVGGSNAWAGFADALITVTGKNDPPVACYDRYTTNEDTVLHRTALEGGLLSNDSDPDRGDDDPKRNEDFTITDLNTHITHGEFTLVGTKGEFNYDPKDDLDWMNQGDSYLVYVVYMITDTHGATARDWAYVEICIEGVNDPPVANPNAYLGGEDRPLIVDASKGLLADDTDPDDTRLWLKGVDTSALEYGELVWSGDGSFEYNPNYQLEPLSEGQEYVVTLPYTVEDEHGGISQGTFTLTIKGANDPPWAWEDYYECTEDELLEVLASEGLLVNDLDPDQADSFRLLGWEPDGTYDESYDPLGPFFGDFDLEADGSFTYDPRKALNWLDEGRVVYVVGAYKIADNHGGRDEGGFAIAVTGINDPPVADDKSVTTDEDTTVEINLSGSDVDRDPLTFSVVTPPGHGILSGTGPNVTYSPAENYNGADSFTYRAFDGHAYSELATVSITVKPVKDPPRLTGIEQVDLPYTENDPATAVTATITATNVDRAMLTSATVQITGGYQKGQDVLAFASTKKIRGKWDAKTGALTLSGTDTVANYQAALRAVKYLNTSENPSNAKRTVTLYVSDGKTNSNAVTRTAAVTPVNDPPVLAHIESKPLAYKEKQAATAVSTSVTVSDVDNPSLAGATVQITGNYKEGQDVLLFTSIPKTSITGTWDPQTGTMSLVGNDTVANYQKALRAVKYRTGTDPGTAARTVTFLANDGRAPSNALTRNITVKAMNDAPVLAGIEPTVLSYAKGQPATVITATITATDVDNLTLASATVQITGGYKKGQDVLAFVNTATIAGTFDAKTGKLTLTGNDSVAAYQAALRAVTYQNVSATPSPAKRTVAFKVYDGAAYSKAATRTVQWATSAAASSATPLAPIQGAGPAANDTALLAMFWPLGSLGRPLGKAEGK